MTGKNLKTFEISGTIKTKESQKNFSKQVNAFNAQNAKERIFMLFGSTNKVKRRNIQVKEVKEIA